jgi:hypothetical protein
MFMRAKEWGSPLSPVESNEYGVQDFHAAAREGPSTGRPSMQG